MFHCRYKMSDNNEKDSYFPIMRKVIHLILLLVVIAGAIYFWHHFTHSTEAAPSAPTPNTSSSSNQTSNPETKRSSASRNRTASPQGGMEGMDNVVTYVKVTSPQQAPIQEVVTSLGTVLPSQSVTVRSQVGGTLQEILFKEGQSVKKGDVLFKIDSRTYQAALDQAKGSLAQNNAKLVNARQDLKRYQTLFKQDSIARQEVDTQQALVREYEASQQSLQAAVEQAQLNLDYTTVTAPMDGRVGLRTVDVGNLITANSTDGLVTITQTQPIDVSFSIPDAYISKVAKPFYDGQQLVVDIFNKDNSQQLAKGHLLSMDNQVDTTTGTIKLKARFENEDYALFPNQFVNVKIVLNTVPDAIVLSNDAIQYGNEGAFVYVVQADNTVKAQNITLGIVNNGFTQIVKGVTTSDKIVTEGLDRLRDGSKVEIVQ